MKIHDNPNFQPDMEFFLELYDPATKKRLYGDDTLCKVTILDEDFPGKLGFEVTDISASRFHDKVEVKVVRTEGTDGSISCWIRTKAFMDDEDSPLNAIKFEDYLPKNEQIEFHTGESEKNCAHLFG